MLSHLGSACGVRGLAAAAAAGLPGLLRAVSAAGAGRGGVCGGLFLTRAAVSPARAFSEERRPSIPAEVARMAGVETFQSSEEDDEEEVVIPLKLCLQFERENYKDAGSIKDVLRPSPEWKVVEGLDDDTAMMQLRKVDPKAGIELEVWFSPSQITEMKDFDSLFGDENMDKMAEQLDPREFLKSLDMPDLDGFDKFIKEQMPGMMKEGQDEGGEVAKRADEEIPDLKLPFDVAVYRKDMDGGMRFLCQATPGKGIFEVTKAMYMPERRLVFPKTERAAEELATYYAGPSELLVNNKMLAAFGVHLYGLGINADLIRYLVEVAEVKERNSFCAWTKKVETFLKL